MLRHTLVFTTAFLLVACTTSQAERPMPHYPYQSAPKIALNVASVEVVEAYTPPMRAPNVEHLMPDPLPSAIAHWARTHFKAVGSEGTATITVKQASVAQMELPRTRGLQGLVTLDQSEKYLADVKVDFSVQGGATSPSGSGGVVMKREQSISEEATLEDRERVWTQMSEALIASLETGTRAMIKERLPFLEQTP